jgi:hypothetical protein
MSNRQIVEDTQRILTIVGFLCAASNSRQELCARGILRAMPDDALYLETWRTVAMLREFSLPMEENYFCYEVESGFVGLRENCSQGVALN